MIMAIERALAEICLAEVCAEQLVAFLRSYKLSAARALTGADSLPETAGFLQDAISGLARDVTCEIVGHLQAAQKEFGKVNTAKPRLVQLEGGRPNAD